MTTQYGYRITIDGLDPALARSGPRGLQELEERARDYETSVKWTLDLISRSQTGRALLCAVQGTGKKMIIRPWLDTSKINASAEALNERDAAPAGEFVLDSSGRAKTGGHWFWKGPMIGTGKGSEAQIRYSPSMFGFGGSSASTFAPTSPGVGQSAILFHEMAHGYRDMRGHQQAVAMVGMRQAYDNEEEFFAILLTNIFVTDPTTAVQSRRLRADHWSFTALPTTQSTSKGFLQAQGNKNLVARLCTQESSLAYDLLSVNATFNPIKEYFRPSTP
jgi:hypothetical protein